MSLLRDTDIAGLVTEKYIVGLKTIGSTAKDDSIQAASLDLHIGNIFVPGEYEVNGEPKAETKYCLLQGHTVFLETKEELDFPPNLAAIGFPPSRVSVMGILMTNPGHVDPGYKGRLHFTVINMGKKPYELREDDAIVTLLFFRLDPPAAVDWRTRRGGNVIPPSTKVNLERLSVDFLDVSERANAAAQELTRKLYIKATIFGGAITGLIALVGILANYWATGYFAQKKEFDDLYKQVVELKGKSDMAGIEARLRLIEEKVNTKDAQKLGESKPKIPQNSSTAKK